MTNDTHVLILGGNGFVGRHLASRFAKIPEWKIDTLGSKECDLTQTESIAILQNKINPQTRILFCSTISRLREDSIKAFNKNVKMAENVAYALSDCSYHSLIFCSSIDVYGRPPSENPITEQTRLNPAGYYGYSKLVSEYILEKELGYNRGLAILRLPGIYSLDESDPSALGAIFNAIRSNLPVQLSGGGKHIRTYLNIFELYTIVETIFFNRWSGLVNLSSSKSYSLRESTEILRSFIGSTSEIMDTISNGSEFDIVISNDKVRYEFPDIMPMPLEQYLEIICKPPPYQPPSVLYSGV